MNTLIKLYEGQTTLQQDVVFIFGIAAVATAWLAIQAGREPSGAPYGARFFAPFWLMDIPRHWICYRSPRWWAPAILAAACAAWIFTGHLVQMIMPGFLGFKATIWKEWPTPLVIHEHRGAAIAFHVVQWFAGNVMLSALSRALLPHSHLAIVIKKAIEETFQKIDLHLRVKQTANDEVIARFRAPITTTEIVRAKSQITNAMDCGLRVVTIHEVRPCEIKIRCGISTAQIKNPSSEADNTENKLQAHEQNYVYFITYTLGDCEVVKIGKSNEPKRVLRDCRRFVPTANLVGALKYSENVNESKIHALFPDERLEHQSGDDMSEVFAISPRIKAYLHRIKQSA